MWGLRPSDDQMLEELGKLRELVREEMEMGLVVETLDRLRGLAASVKPDMTATWILVDSSIIPEFLFSKLPF